MTSATDANRGSFDPIKLACWVGIVVYVVMKVVLLSRGATLKELFDFGDPSLWGLMVGACVMGLILRSPTMRQKATLIEANETRAVTISFTTVFIVMAAYYFLRPVRDSMASDWTDAEISQLWTLQFFLSLALVMVYGLLCSKIRFRLLVPAVYSFYAITFALFFFLASAFSEPFQIDLGFSALTVDQTLIDKTFYMWVSLFSLFHLSVFWSFMADTFSQEQSKRVFAFIAAGASAGAAAGPLVVAVIANDVGNETLMLLAAGLLMLAIPLVLYLQRLKVVDLHNEDVHANLAAAKMGGRWWAGFGDFFTSPYLMAIGLFILLYTGIQAFIYFEQTELLRIYEAREARTTILSLRDGIVNILTFGLGLFITSRIVRKLGMPVALALLPLFATVALLILAMVPLLVVFLAVDIARRAGEYGLTRPAREMLFTSVDRETRFKTKPVVDVAVYRAGDAWWGAVFSFLSEGIGFGYSVMSVIGAGIGAVWVASGIYLGRAFNRREGQREAQAAAEPKVFPEHAAGGERAAT
jgi:AAA family ATP:ADP antiporter